ncbi:MAG: sulfatase-like hydrolase/transferase, partial [Planctomycetes bacterium]|nr:sulfatase-like hydrolase/transferase [Planctomycetota bacterium]
MPGRFLRDGSFCAFVVLALLAAAGSCAFGQVPSRPNIIIVMTDDQGWGDTGYNGHPNLLTPNLDTMASAGLRFNRFYCIGPVCSPTRAAQMTGRHYDRMNINTANDGRMLNAEITLGELAQTQGYRTGHFGKWHLGTLTRDLSDSNRGAPDNQAEYSPSWTNGFDTCFSTEAKVPTYWNDTGSESYNNYGTRYWTGPGQSIDTTSLPPEIRGDDSKVVMDQTLAFIGDALAGGEPFLAVNWFHTPHKPVVLDPEYQDAYAGFSGEELDYYTALSAMDAQVGRLREYLRDPNGDGDTSDSIADNTLIIFTADNGPENNNAGAATEQSTIGDPDGPGGDDPIDLRGRKRDVYEGGVRVPGIIEWAGQIMPGISDTPVCGPDILSTLLDIWNISMPDARPMDGQSIAPVLFEGQTVRGSTIRFQYLGDKAIADDQYKLVDTGTGWQLFDIVADPEESTNIYNQSAATQAVGDALKADFNAWTATVTASSGGADYRTYIASAAAVHGPGTPPGGGDPGEPVTLIDDPFNGSVVADSDGAGAVGGGFNFQANSGAAGNMTAVESGGAATVTVAGGNTANGGLVSAAAFDAAAQDAFRMTFEILSVGSLPTSNGHFLGLADTDLQTGVTFFRDATATKNFGFVFFGDEAKTGSGGGFGLVKDDIGSPGADVIFASADVTSDSYLDGFTASFTLDADGWYYEVAGLSGGTHTGAGLWTAAGLASTFYTDYFDAQEYIVTSYQSSDSVTYGRLLVESVDSRPNTSPNPGDPLNVDIITNAPADLAEGGLESDTAVRLIVERQLATLPNDLASDSDGTPGAYTDTAAMPGGTLAAGTVVESYLVHCDPVAADLYVDMTMTFEHDILGVIADSQKLVDSDFLAYRDPAFDGAGSLRGALESQDGGWIIGPDGRTIDLAFRVGATGLDQVRILTEAPLQFVLVLPVLAWDAAADDWDEADAWKTRDGTPAGPFPNTTIHAVIDNGGTVQVGGDRSARTLTVADGTVDVLAGQSLAVGGAVNVAADGALAVHGTLAVGTAGYATTSTVATPIQGGGTGILSLGQNATMSADGGLRNFAAIHLDQAAHLTTGETNNLTQALALGTDAVLDLTSGNLIVDYATPPTGDYSTEFLAIETLVKSGFQDGPLGYWDGPGIQSSAAAASGDQSTTLATFDNAGPGGGKTNLEGELVDATSVLVKYAWYGDINLDGVVDFNDYNIIDNTFLSGVTTGKHWQ